MKNFNIATYRTRYVVPFEVDLERQSFEELCRNIDGHTDYLYSFLGQTESFCWERKMLWRGEQDIYSYLIGEFSPEKEYDYAQEMERTGCYFELSGLRKNHFRFWYTKSKQYSEEDRVAFSIGQMGLYVFRCGVGLLWYEVYSDGEAFQTAEELIHFQNIFKELNRGNNNHLWIEGESIPQPENYRRDVIPFMMGNFIAERLQFLNARYQASRSNSYPMLLAETFAGKRLDKEQAWKKSREFWPYLPKYCPDKALLFTYAVFEADKEWKKDEDSLKIAYYLTSGYKESYKMSPEYVDEVKNPFANVYWVAAREGCGYFGWTDEENRIFFTKNMKAKVMDDYFLLYIRAIYQSYSLMHYALYTTVKLPNNYQRYLKVSEETEQMSDCIAKIVAEISLFMVKSVTTSVSHIQHQNDFYNYLIERLKIKEDIASVTAGLKALNELQQETLLKKQSEQERKERQERSEAEEREKEADNRFQLGLGIVAILAVISAVTDAVGLVASFDPNSLGRTQWTVLILLWIGVAAAFGVSIWLLGKAWKAFRGKK